MKPLLPLFLCAALCSFVCFADRPTPAQAALPLEEEPDYGPLILQRFFGMLPDVLIAAAASQSGDPQQSAQGAIKLGQSFGKFLDALQLATRQPDGLKGLKELIKNQELLTASLEQELASEACVTSVRTWKKSLEKTEAPATLPAA